jgi:hypothetical protein
MTQRISFGVDSYMRQQALTQGVALGYYASRPWRSILHVNVILTQES